MPTGEPNTNPESNIPKVETDDEAFDRIFNGGVRKLLNGEHSTAEDSTGDTKSSDSGETRDDSEQSHETRVLEELVAENAELRARIDSQAAQLTDLQAQLASLLSQQADLLQKIDSLQQNGTQKFEQTTDTDGDGDEQEQLKITDKRRVRLNNGKLERRFAVDRDGVITEEWQEIDDSNQEDNPEQNSTTTAGKEIEAGQNDGSDDRETEDNEESELTKARKEYAQATAKRRGGIAGNLLNRPEGKLHFLKKLPIFGKLIDKYNDFIDSKTLASQREAYRAAIKTEQQKAYDAVIEAMGDSEEAKSHARATAANLVLQSDKLLEISIAGYRMEQGGPSERFLNWWVDKGNDGTKLKKIRKTLILAAGGITAGALIGLGGVPLGVAMSAGAAIGLGAGGELGRRISKRRASGIEADGRTVAERKRDEALHDKEHVALDAITSGASAEELSDVLIDNTEGATIDDETGNRRRTGTGVAAGAVGGAGFAAAGTALRSNLENMSQPSRQSSNTPELHSRPNGFDGQSNDDEYVAPVQGPSTPTPSPEITPQLPGISGYNYPWDWARDAFGADDASARLHELGQLAQGGGHEVAWYTTVDGGQAIMVDGKDDVNSVLRTLEQYTGQLKP